MNKLFSKKPRVENSFYRIRFVKEKDLNDLLEIYSNDENLKFVNNDDCNGDSLYCDNLELLKEKYQFWKYAYKKNWFIKLSIIDKKNNKVIGLIELLKRERYDSFNNALIIKLDCLLEYESKEILKSIFNLLERGILKDISYTKIAIKASSYMFERKETLIELGFKLSNRILIGLEDNKAYKDYYVRKK